MNTSPGWFSSGGRVRIGLTRTQAKRLIVALGDPGGELAVLRDRVAKVLSLVPELYIESRNQVVFDLTKAELTLLIDAIRDSSVSDDVLAEVYYALVDAARED